MPSCRPTTVLENSLIIAVRLSEVDSYLIQYAYFVDHDNPEFKAPWNQLRNIPRVSTPEAKAIQTPNSDTPYSFIGMDLRAEPIVLTVPAIAKDRYFSIQLIDAYTYNRYLLNSPMLPQFRRDADGGITLEIQHDSPGADKESNWLPAPKGAFIVFMRLYWPKPEALDGAWKQPSMRRVQ